MRVRGLVNVPLVQHRCCRSSTGAAGPAPVLRQLVLQAQAMCLRLYLAYTHMETAPSSADPSPLLPSIPMPARDPRNGDETQGKCVRPLSPPLPPPHTGKVCPPASPPLSPPNTHLPTPFPALHSYACSRSPGWCWSPRQCLTACFFSPHLPADLLSPPSTPMPVAGPSDGAGVPGNV
eukprot:318365-Chlamydomonas_euryale.AAC.4